MAICGETQVANTRLRGSSLVNKRCNLLTAVHKELNISCYQNGRRVGSDSKHEVAGVGVYDHDQLVRFEL